MVNGAAGAWGAPLPDLGVEGGVVVSRPPKSEILHKNVSEMVDEGL